MAEAVHSAKSRQLRSLATRLDTLADAVEQPSRTLDRANQLIAEGESIAKDVWSVFRGRR